MGKAWVPLESNPEVLTDYITKIGLPNPSYIFHDVFGLDEELLMMVPQPVLAVIMCFPVTPQLDKAAEEEDEAQEAQGISTDASLFYMKQTVGNACGTIAVLHSLGNNKDKLTPETGSFLDLFYSATSSMTPEERGGYLEDPPVGGPNIEEAHQAAASSGATAAPSAEDNVDLHFVAFVNHKGVLVELDGRRKGPMIHGPTTDESLLQDSAKVVKRFIERTDNVNFNLIALAGPGDD